jgi:hypothetical protein
MSVAPGFIHCSPQRGRKQPDALSDFCSVLPQEADRSSRTLSTIVAWNLTPCSQQNSTLLSAEDRQPQPFGAAVGPIASAPMEQVGIDLAHRMRQRDD